METRRTRDLQAAGIARRGPRIAHFGDPARESRAALEGDAIFDLQHLALISAGGVDAEAFLQGQLTGDVSQLGAGRAQTSAWCSPKGRVLACFLVFRHRGSLMLQLPAMLLESILNRMRMFVLRAKVTLEDASEVWVRMGAVGGDTESRLRAFIGPLPEQAGAVRSSDDVTVIRLAGPRPRYEIVANRETVEALWDDCREVADLAGADAWELLDIEAGIPSIVAETSDSFVPQMLNLDRIGAVSFTKGCYVGQEIVARTQHLGRIKRRMYRAHWNGSSHIGPGDTLEAADDPAPTKVQIVNAGPQSVDGVEVLAVLPMDVANRISDTGLVLGDGTRLVLQALPYALQDETA